MRFVSGFLVMVVLAFWTGVQAGEKKEEKEVTLKGTITCPKCDLKTEKACWTVLVVKKDKKDVVYYFDKEANKKHHGTICTEAMKGEVTGVVSKEGKKNILTVKSLKFD